MNFKPRNGGCQELVLCQVDSCKIGLTSQHALQIQSPLSLLVQGRLELAKRNYEPFKLQRSVSGTTGSESPVWAWQAGIDLVTHSEIPHSNSRMLPAQP